VNPAPLVLIDLSSIAHPLWHLSGSEPDPNWTSTQIIAKVRALASGQPHVAICVDGPRSRDLRKAIDPTYKAQRDTAPEALFHQIKCAIDVLRADGFPIWEADGYEADDVIASAVHAALVPDAVKTDLSSDILIVTADKDLCQLVGPRVTIKHALKGDVLDEAAVVAKFGITPAQIGDYLALVGDASDNIKGAKGIGAKTAVKLLASYGSLDKIMAGGGEGLTPAVRDSLVEFSSRCDTVRALIALRTDVPVNIEEAFAARVPATAPEEPCMPEPSTEPSTSTAAPATGNSASPPPQERVDRAPDTSVESHERAQVQQELLRVGQLMPAPAPTAWEMQLEPRSMMEAWDLSRHMFQSKLFNAYGTPDAVLSTILAGRELGLQAMASLRAMHIIEGKPTLSAGAIQSLVLKSKLCTYFRCTERTNTHATFVGKRGNDPEVRLTFTVEDAKRAWSGAPEKFEKSGWGRNPADLCVARAATKLARLLWPDVIAGFYAVEEMQD
jgi:5'-3' exonuclease